MAETLFYHLERRSLEEVLPDLLERTLARGWRALVRCDSAERAEALDTLLWTFRDDSFLPHARDGEGEEALQPVLIAVEPHLANRPDVLFLAGGVAMDWRAPEAAGLARIVLLFDGRDSQLLSLARAAWKDARAAGHDVTYWKESPSGKFEKQG